MSDFDYIWVDSDRKLQTARKESRVTRLIGIDTEYDSFRYFREKLCLLQIKTENRTFLFDPLNDLDISFLGEAFSDPDIPKIVHAGDNDIRLLKRDYGFKFRNVFDTQRAAMLLGCKYLALTAVIQQILGIEVRKTKHIQRSQWETRPLSAEQMEYAVQDIDYLFPLYEKLRAELAANGLHETAEEAFREIAAVEWSEKRCDPYGYARMEGFSDMKKHQKARLKSLYEWRFKKAKATNIAVFMVLSDQNLIDLSRSSLYTRDDLRKKGHLSEGRVERFGAEILRIIAKSGTEDGQESRTAQGRPRH